MNIIDRNMGNDQIIRISNELISFYKQFRNCIYITILATIVLVTSTTAKERTRKFDNHCG